MAILYSALSFRVQLFLLLLLASLAVLAQKPGSPELIHMKKAADSIDYNVLYSDRSLYKLVSVTQHKEKQEPGLGQLFLYRFTGNNLNPLGPGPWPKPNDTLIFLTWLRTPLMQPLIKEKRFGQVRIDPGNNILTITYYEAIPGSTNLSKNSLRFKVLKCTTSSVVLWDLTYFGLERMYYFQRE